MKKLEWAVQFEIKLMWRLQGKRSQIIKQHIWRHHNESDDSIFPISYFGMEFGNRIVILLESESVVRMLAFANFPLIILDRTLPW